MTFSIIVAYIAFAITSSLLIVIASDYILNYNTPVREALRNINAPYYNMKAVLTIAVAWVISGVYLFG